MSLGSGIRKKTYPGSRGQNGTRSRIRIRNTRILKATGEKSKIRIQISNPVVRILLIFTLASWIGDLLIFFTDSPGILLRISILGPSYCSSVNEPDRVGSASFCRILIGIGIQGIPIRILSVPDVFFTFSRKFNMLSKILKIIDTCATEKGKT